MRASKTIVEQARRHRRALSVVSLGAALALFHGPALWEHLVQAANHWRFADDVRVLIHPLFRLEDPRLFPADPSVEYFLKSLPDGYHLLYRALGPLVGVELLSKALPYPLLAVTLACIGFASGRLSGRAAVLGALSLSLGSAYLLARMAGGLPRSFALPLLAAGAALLVAGRVKGLAVLVVFAAGFYPVAALVLGAALALWLLLPLQERGEAESWPWKRRVLLVAATAVLAGLVLLPSTLRLREYGAAITPELWPEFPEAGPNGRFDAPDRAPFPPLPDAALPPLESSLSGAGVPLFAALHPGQSGRAAVSAVALFALLGWFPLALRSREARRLLLLVAAVVLCHTLALGAGLRLFIPERYVAYGVPVLALIMVPSALGALAGAKQLRVRALPVAYNLALIAWLGAHGSGYSGLTIFVPQEETRLYRTIGALPVSSVVAGWPGEAIDNVPYLSRRAAFVTRETQMAFHTEYTRAQRARTRALIRGYFAGTRDELVALRDRHGVTHLLVDRRHFVERPGYFAPFDVDAARAFDAARSGTGFAALAAIPRARVFESGTLVLLELARL